MGRGKKWEFWCETIPYAEPLQFTSACPNLASQLQISSRSWCLWLLFLFLFLLFCLLTFCSWPYLVTPELCWWPGTMILLLPDPHPFPRIKQRGKTPQTHLVQPFGCKCRTWCWHWSGKPLWKCCVCRQSAELNKLRQDYARLMNELGEKSSKLQQEELQKKNAEQAVAQLKVPGVFSACQVVLRVLSEPGWEGIALAACFRWAQPAWGFV